jgi:hypothetical protein
MNAVWKFPLGLVKEQRIDIPGPWEPLLVADQGGTVCLWASVTPGGHVRSHRIVMVGTGWEFDSAGLEPLGSVVAGPYVWHFWLDLQR